MKTKTRSRQPALFISKTGASKAGLKVLVKLPCYIETFEVIGPNIVNGDVGYHLMLIPANDNEVAAYMTYETLEQLI